MMTIANEVPFCKFHWSCNKKPKNGKSNCDFHQALVDKWETQTIPYPKLQIWFCSCCRATFLDFRICCGVKPIVIERAEIKRDVNGRIIECRAASTKR